MKRECEYCNEDTGFYVKETLENLEHNTFTASLCDTCGLGIMGKTSDGELKLGIVIGKTVDDSIPVKWLSFEEFLDTHQQIKINYEKNLHEQWSH